MLLQHQSQARYVCGDIRKSWYDGIGRAPTGLANATSCSRLGVIPSELSPLQLSGGVFPMGTILAATWHQMSSILDNMEGVMYGSIP